jgi:hypothetical protein
MKKKIVFTYQICQTLEVWHLPQKQLNNKSSTYKNQKDPFLHLGASCLEMDMATTPQINPCCYPVSRIKFQNERLTSTKVHLIKCRNQNSQI